MSKSRYVWDSDELDEVIAHARDTQKAFNPNQPRVPAGNPKGGQWTSGGDAGAKTTGEEEEEGSGVPGAEHAGGMDQYLEMRANHPLLNNGRPSLEKFMLEHGRGFPMDAHTFIGGERHMCYKNAFEAVMADSNLTYVEGYMSVYGVPIHHAWAVDANGAVRDFTIWDKEGIEGYFGVPLKTRWVSETMLETGVYGVLMHERTPEILAADPSTVVHSNLGASQRKTLVTSILETARVANALSEAALAIGGN